MARQRFIHRLGLIWEMISDPGFLNDKASYFSGRGAEVHRDGTQEVKGQSTLHNDPGSVFGGQYYLVGYNAVEHHG